MVQGGRYFGDSQWVAEETVAELKRLVSLAPSRLPHELTAIEMRTVPTPG